MVLLTVIYDVSRRRSFPWRKRYILAKLRDDVVGGIPSSGVTEQSASRKAPRISSCAMTSCGFLCNVYHRY